MQSDPNPANFLYDAKKLTFWLLDFGATHEVANDIRQLMRGILEACIHHAQLGMNTSSITRQQLTDIGVLQGAPLTQMTTTEHSACCCRLVPAK